MNEKRDESFWHEVADYVQGTCKSTDEVLTTFGLDDENEFLLKMEELGEHLCEQCGWWKETCELSEDEGVVCQDCADGY